MPEINLANGIGHDARVVFVHNRIKKETAWVDQEGHPVQTKKILRGTTEQDVSGVLEKYGGDLGAVGQALVNGDPEIDHERYGYYLNETSQVYVNSSYDLVFKVKRIEVVHTPDGEEKERRAKVMSEPNVAADVPVKWTGKMIKKSHAYRRFVFGQTLQLRHVNGLTYRFLFEMAEELEKEDALMLLAGGPKGRDPIVFRRGGKPFRAFLGGRTKGNSYALLLHLSNMELKQPASSEDE
jgi:hypothetical protein